MAAIVVDSTRGIGNGGCGGSNGISRGSSKDGGRGCSSNIGADSFWQRWGQVTARANNNQPKSFRMAVVAAAMVAAMTVGMAAAVNAATAAAEIKAAVAVVKAAPTLAEAVADVATTVAETAVIAGVATAAAAAAVP
jgi:hypothetical protein